MNIPRQVGLLLEAAGHRCRHVGDVGLLEAEDHEIVAAAKAAGEAVLTHDLDFGSLLAFSGDSRPSVLILRQRNLHPERLYESLHRTEGRWLGALEQGAVVILEEGALRVRNLPIDRG